MAALSAELAPLVGAPGQRWERGLYAGVLSWLGDAAVEVIVARLGPAQEGERFELDLRTTTGRHVRVEELPGPRGRMLRVAMDRLAGDHGVARVELAAAAAEPDPAVRAQLVVDALVWVNALLDAPTSAFPDPPPR